MRIITLGLDSTILDKNSSLAKRFLEYGALVERHDVVVPGASDGMAKLLDTVFVYSVAGTSKVHRLARMMALARKLIRKNQYDIISTRDISYLSLAVLWLARRYGLGFELQVHGFEKFEFLRRRIARYVFKRADGIRTVSERLKRKLVRDFHVSAQRIVVCPIFVDCKGFAEKAERMRGEQGNVNAEFTFVTVGRLVPVKNIGMQFRALSELAKKRFRARLIVAGDGPERGHLEKMARELGVPDRVTFRGTVKDVVSVFAGADCFVLTSHEEGYGLATVEAACFGLPVVMTDVGCAGEVIINGKNGIVVPVGDEHALVGAMEKIIKDGELRQKIVEANKDICKKVPSHERTLDLYRQSWENVLARRQH